MSLYIKKFNYIILSSFIFIACYINNAYANDYFVVDIENIIHNSNAAQNARKELEQIKNEYQKDIDRQEALLTKEEQQLKKEQSTLSSEAFNKKLREFQTKIAEMQRGIQIKRSNLEEAYSKVIAAINTEVYKIIADLAKEQKAKIVFPTSQILFADQSLNKSAEVMDRLNKKITKIKLEIK